MWIVVLWYDEDGRHSAWNTEKEAIHQAEVIGGNLNSHPTVIFDETVRCENGHYYV